MNSFYIGNVALGDKIYYSPTVDRYVLAPNDVMAGAIYQQLRYDVKDIELTCCLTEASKILHTRGDSVTIVNMGTEYNVDTVLVLGCPKGLDTTKPNKVLFK